MFRAFTRRRKLELGKVESLLKLRKSCKKAEEEKPQVGLEVKGVQERERPCITNERATLLKRLKERRISREFTRKRELVLGMRERHWLKYVRMIKRLKERSMSRYFTRMKELVLETRETRKLVKRLKEGSMSKGFTSKTKFVLGTKETLLRKYGEKD